MSAPVRRWKRYKVDFRVRIRRLTETEDRSIVVRTYELSEGGMSVYAPVEFATGTELRLEFTVPTAKRAVRTTAVVRNRRGFRCGLEFTDVSATDKREIGRYLTMVHGPGAD